MMQATDIVIAVRGTREFPIEVDFENCIESLVKYTTNYRLILVDDNSDEEGRRVVEKVASQFPTSVLIRTHTQNWFTRAYNKGLRMVKTPKAVALNADVICVDGWLDELYEVMKEVEAQPGQANKVGLVGHNGPGDGPEGARWMCTVPGRGYVTGHCWLLSMDALGKVAAWRRTPGYYLDETNPANAHIRSDICLLYTSPSPRD